ncbi:16S rRNA C1402 (ribose-2'-O) methylase RsmI (RsmI) [Fructobacillus fructosus]|uniref:16S rRNA (cytidine(1402)-2'-O)-methyltransferase n=1 Tax=Fructobacillus fructosus TaxID=1631 RepID=UPI0002195721|nr:16S rRNA (cytidine(1402)-2'-O)-methyltransferase [Fructobacillus fructosus]GAP01739.1 methyltransferase [Fructobacillus fructosus]CAK1235288.1 16S rRNA C1402 (ribose-2'-O) methylase RsmI (RsmI) [Fructobacillus fructosus]CAK1239465.1 16S rRNA C1402 (ribose-2'-O) methylase RsmI (RsmI) [Fructobacillus fructosus]
MQIQKSFTTHDTGTLYLVGTPIGNLSDMSSRALEVLQEVDVIAAEDTRHTQLLLNYFDIKNNKTSLHEHNWQEKAPELVQELLAGKSIAQVSDAGLPSISDPGKELVAQAIEANVPVVPIPGASAGITALIASGLVPQPFYFHGFLPRKKQEQAQALQDLSWRPETMIFYEAPHRLKKTLQNLVEVLGEKRRIVLARELTKRYEEFLRGTAVEAVQWAEENDIRGEFVLLVEGRSDGSGVPPKAVADTTDTSAANPEEAVQALIDQGLKPNAAIKQVAKENGLNRQDLYKSYHHIEEENG